MKKTLYIIYIILFFALCVTPLALMPFFGTDATTENRALSKPPSLTVDGAFNTNVGNDTETYLSEHFAFRSPIVTAYARLKSALFASSAESSVIIGRGGWLYFDETVGDYIGTKMLGEREIFNLASKLSLIREYVEASGGTFVFAVAPNKNSVYPNFMPSRYIKTNGTPNMQRLLAALNENGVSYAPLYDILSEAARSGQVYHKLDTHWNNLGAAYGFREIMRAAGLEYTDYAAMDYTLTDTHHGDLWGMLYPALDGVFDEQVDFGVNYSYEYTTRFKTAEDLTIKTSCASGEGVLVMFRDSFCNAMLPFFAESFAQASFLRGVPYRVDEASDTDVVAVEIVERNLDLLEAQLTVFPAPEREFEDGMTECDADVTAEEKYGFTLVSGILEGEVAVDTRVFVQTDGGILYECCTVGERGFYAYLPEGGCYKIFIK